MKLEGRIHGLRVCVLADNDATQNFYLKKISGVSEVEEGVHA